MPVQQITGMPELFITGMRKGVRAVRRKKNRFQVSLKAKLLKWGLFSILACLEVTRLVRLARLARLARLVRLG